MDMMWIARGIREHGIQLVCRGEFRAAQCWLNMAAGMVRRENARRAELRRIRAR